MSTWQGMDQNPSPPSFHPQLKNRVVNNQKLAWIIPSSLTNRGNKRYNEFIEKCKDDAVNKSIPIIDETDPKYFLYIQDYLPIPRIEEEPKNKVSENQNKKKSIGIVEYVSAMSKEHQQIAQKQLIVVPQKHRKKKKK